VGWRDRVDAPSLGGGGDVGRTVYLRARDLGEDAAATIQAALDNPRVTCVVLPPGEFGIGTTIIIPSGKTLMGAGKDSTTLVALDDFQSPPGIACPGAMIFADGASDVTISDLTLDGAKVGLTSTGEFAGKVSGIVLYNTTDFLVQDVHVQNVTGYAQWAVGDWNYSNPELSTFSSGKYIDCSTANANVHFEQTTASGIHILRSVSTDGDGDIPTEAYLHPLVGSTGIVYEDVVVFGTGNGVGAIIVSLGVPIGTVTFINPDIVTKNNGMTIIGSQGAPVELVEIQGGHVESYGNMGILTSWTTNMVITDASISGQKIGIFTYDGTIQGINSSIEASLDLTGGATYALVHTGAGTAEWTGPLISTSTNGPEFNYSGTVAWFYDGAYRDNMGAALPDAEGTLPPIADGSDADTVAPPSTDTVETAAPPSTDTVGAGPQDDDGSSGREATDLATVLADALAGGGGSDLDALLGDLGQQSPGGDPLAIVSQSGEPSWAMPASGPFAGLDAFAVDAFAFHPDAAPPA
jgi:hypothetical protein